MTRKHFTELADHIRPAMVKDGQFIDERAEQIADALLDFCKSQNPQFKPVRWTAYLLSHNGERRFK